MAKYIVQGEAYLDNRSHLHPVGSEVDLPDSGRHSVPPPGWIDLDTDEPVTHEEHELASKTLAAELKEAGVAEAKAKLEAAAARKAEKVRARAEADKTAKGKKADKS